MVRHCLGVERLRGLGYDDLQRRTEWLTLDGPDAYEVLATDHWNEVADQLREDVATGFQRLKQQFIDRAVQTTKQTFPENASEPFVRNTIETRLKPDIEEYLKGLYGAAALAGIERHGSPEDAPLARKYLQSTLDRDLAIRALARVGDASDVPELMRVAADSYDETKIAAAELAYRLSGNSEEVLRGFLQSSDAQLVRIALLEMEEQGDEALIVSAVDLLKRDEAAVREVAAEVVTRLLNREQLLSLSEAYASGHYYYNVVVALDRALYCTLLGETGLRERPNR